MRDERYGIFPYLSSRSRGGNSSALSSAAQAVIQTLVRESIASWVRTLAVAALSSAAQAVIQTLVAVAALSSAAQAVPPRATQTLERRAASAGIEAETPRPGRAREFEFKPH